MSNDEAEALRRFIKDHDTRFEASVSGEGGRASVELRSLEEGAPLERVESIEQYRESFIDAHDPGPTIREAWEKWRGSGQ
jgi:hypothetical protein